MVSVHNDIVNGMMWMGDKAEDILYQILCLILSFSVEQA